MNEENNQNVNNELPNQNTNTSLQEKKPLDKKVIIIAVVAILVVAILLFVFLGKGGSSSGGTGGGGSTSEKEQKIEVSSQIISKDKLLVKLTNNKTTANDVHFYATFYDETGTEIRVYESTMRALSPGETGYQAFNIAGLEQNKYEVKIQDETPKDLGQIHTSKIAVTSTKNENEIIVRMENNSKQLIEVMQISVVYYKGNDIVAFSTQSVSDIDVDTIINEAVMLPMSNTNKLIDFDKYDVSVRAFNN